MGNTNKFFNSNANPERKGKIDVVRSINEIHLIREESNWDIKKIIDFMILI